MATIAETGHLCSQYSFLFLNDFSIDFKKKKEGEGEREIMCCPLGQGLARSVAVLKFKFIWVSYSISTLYPLLWRASQ